MVETVQQAGGGHDVDLGRRREEAEHEPVRAGVHVLLRERGEAAELGR
jgi:hypothetical protein